MDYSSIFDSNVDAFSEAGMLKVAIDMIKILNMEEFGVGKPESWDYLTASKAEARENAFNKFCAVCLASGVKLPDLEVAFYEAPLFDFAKGNRDKALVKEADAVRDHVNCQLEGKRSIKDVKLCRALQTVADLFPDTGYQRYSDKKMRAMMNRLLLGLGCEPIRPDYSTIRINLDRMTEPKREVKILIVDDNKEEALKTAIAIAGWPAVNIEFFFYNSKCSWKKLQDQEKENVLLAAAQEVLGRRAQIILMDQGLGDIEGSELIGVIEDIVSDFHPWFVGNTGGSDEKLIAAGALQNCEKGKNIAGISQAIKLLD